MRYKITLMIETKRDIKFPEDAQILESLEQNIYSHLDGYVTFEPSNIQQVGGLCTTCGDCGCAGCSIPQKEHSVTYERS